MLDFRPRDPAVWQAVLALCRVVAEAGGRAHLVGGSVRDALLGLELVDFDVEVFGLESAALRTLIEKVHAVDFVGEAFGVFKLRRLPIDVSLPRRETKVGGGHRGFEIAADPAMSFEQAARRRDFTINAIAFDPLRGILIDPFAGVDDLRLLLLRHTSERFAEDPLRVLRGMQLVARFELTADPTTLELCAALDDADLAPERIFEEWRKLLVLGRRPGLGLRFLRAAAWAGRIPELAALIDCPQDPEWHPEGDVWIHTCHTLDAFAAARIGDPWEDLVVGLACLCHDLGKPATTRFADGRWRSLGHEDAGETPTRALLARMTSQRDLVDQVTPLVLHHLKPRQLFSARAGDAAVRRLARKVGRIDRLVRVARADAGGRPPLPIDDDEAGRWLLAQAERLQVAAAAPRPLVMGRHLVAHGMTPGPSFGPLLDRCYRAQLDGRFEDLEGGLAYLERLPARGAGASDRANETKLGPDPSPDHGNRPAPASPDRRR